MASLAAKAVAKEREIFLAEMRNWPVSVPELYHACATEKMAIATERELIWMIEEYDRILSFLTEVVKNSRTPITNHIAI